MNRSPTTIDRGLLAELPLPEHESGQGKAGRGKLLLVAGSAGLPGAAILAARAALRVGCGTVRVAAPRSVATAIGVAVPELMVVPLPEGDDGTVAESALEVLERQFKPCDAAVIGPGLGSGSGVGRLCVGFLAASPLPTVVDAGALLAWAEAGSPAGPAPRILTPHVGEMAGMSNLDPEGIGRDRDKVAARLARQWGAVLALKGAETVVAGAGLYLNTAGSPGLGTAGSGDVLAGVVGGLLARGAAPTAAAVWGVHIHALAGEVAAARHGVDGMIASDVVEALPEAIRSLLEPTRNPHR